MNWTYNHIYIDDPLTSEILINPESHDDQRRPIYITSLEPMVKSAKLLI